MQKQNFQIQITEIDNALEEISKSKGEVYKIIGPIMVSSDKKKIEEDLKSKKEVMSIRLSNLEKQENKIKEEATAIQSDVLKDMKKKESSK
jgi:prefoldin beta subunit